MKNNCKKSFGLSFKILVGLLILPLIDFISFAQTKSSMDLRPWFTDKSYVWSGETNGFRAAICRKSDAPVKEVAILVVSSTNAGFVYFLPASGRPPKMELQDANNIIIPPVKNSMDGELTKTISEGNLPQYHADGALTGHGIKFKSFSIGANTPYVLKEFDIGDVYKVKKEDVYVLTVFPVVYKLEPNGKYADRIDLPCVTTKVHLVPSE